MTTASEAEEAGEGSQASDDSDLSELTGAENDPFGGTTSQGPAHGVPWQVTSASEEARPRSLSARQVRPSVGLEQPQVYKVGFQDEPSRSVSPPCMPDDSVMTESCKSATNGNGDVFQHRTNSRQRRNSLALRKNIPTQFSVGVNASSMNSSDLYDGDTRDVDAFKGVKCSEEDSYTIGRGGVGGSSVGSTDKKWAGIGTRKLGILRGTCLNPRFSLQKQMMLSFGLVSVTMIGAVMTVCIVVTLLSGQNANNITSENFDLLANDMGGSTVRYIAEFLTYRLIPTDLVLLLWETTRDRMAGYPHALGFAEDETVPFFDMETKKNRYPTVHPPLPLDWQVCKYANVLEDNYQEHVQDRWKWYHLNTIGNFEHHTKTCLSTQTAGYFMQGMCDPNVTDPAHPHYYQGCTDANNDIKTGGVIAPTDMNELLHRKAGDLTPIFKALYEHHHDVKSIGVAFANRGAGSGVYFPLSSVHSSATYVSNGCDWMEQANPYKPNQTIGGVADVTSRCHPAGSVVSYRENNPMEQDWCRKQALEPEKFHVEGPQLDEASWHGIDEYRWTLTVGRALYDRLTLEFIGCIRVNLVLDFLHQVLVDASITKNSHITLVRWDEGGTVVASSAQDMTKENHTLTIDILDVGVTKENYVVLRDLIDYNLPWNSTELRNRYESFVTTQNNFLIVAYPIPPPPKQYDPEYRPQFLAVKSLSKDDVFNQLYASKGVVDDQVNSLVNLTLLIGFVGLFVVLLIIVLVSNKLTSPLQFMNEVATAIVNNYVDNSEDGINYQLNEAYHSWCMPRTEITEVVAGFQKMVERFSGTANAKAMKGSYTEVINRFEMFSQFSDLYASRDEPCFKYKLDKQVRAQNGHILCSEKMPSRKHVGSILYPGDTVPTVIRNEASEGSLEAFSLRKRRWFLSPLFLWIVILLVLPLLATTILLSVVVSFNISREFPELVTGAKADYLSIESFALQVYVDLRANFVSEYASRATRDLHLLTRYTSWLLFGGISRSESFTETITGVEECKWFSNRSECPYIQAMPCDCAWGDRARCEMYDIDSRYLQSLAFSTEASDALADGDRLNTSYPAVAFSPNTTVWWANTSVLPGFGRGINASGYDTTYDRIRVLSALPVLQPLFNYDVKKEFVSGIYVAMEDDGTFLGYEGCGNGLADGSGWSSTNKNGGPKTRPELCPNGKFGYDPRCRGWYHTGRMRFLENSTTVYLTPPYVFSGGILVAQSATGALVDPVTSHHLGQTLVDFKATVVFDTLSPENTPLKEYGYPVLITPTVLEAVSGGDTVIGPGLVRDTSTLPPRIEDLVLAHESRNCTTDCIGREQFIDIVADMKRGKLGSAEFVKEASDGSIQEMFIAYAPVWVPSLSPKNSYNFSSGVNSENLLIYSVAFVADIEGLLGPFEVIAKDMEKQRNVALVVLCIVIVLSSLLVVYISNRVAVSITKPMLYLVELIRHINRLSADDISTSLSPEVDRDYGCREVRHVASTMEVLYKVVRDANVAFFAGDVETAYAVLTDTLRLFHRLDNKKAIGVSNNNLGNTMLTIYRRMEDTKEERVCGFTRKEVVQKGIGYFHKAIKLGEAAYDDFYEREGWSPNCLEFMQHLSNRYFNRAMFLLTVKESHNNPKELEELGLRDLQIVRDMDVEIVDEGTQVGWDVRTPDQLFDVKLNRVKGHLWLLEMGYPDEWDVNELLDEASKIVRDELLKPESKLFSELTPAGRMQQVELELMRYLMIKEDVGNAAKIAIRILLEDEYTLADVQDKSVQVLLAYMQSQKCDDPHHRSVKRDLINYQAWLNMTEEEEHDHQHSSNGPDERSEVFQLSTARISSTVSTGSRSRKNAKRASHRGDFTMEVF